jgi:uncharacterized protein (TIGR02246 family)
MRYVRRSHCLCLGLVLVVWLLGDWAIAPLSNRTAARASEPVADAIAQSQGTDHLTNPLSTLDSPTLPNPMQPETLRSIIWQARDAWISGDADAFANLFAPDGELIVPGNRWTGPDAIRQVVVDYSAAYSNVEIEIRQILVEGDRVAVEWTWSETENATGQRHYAEDAILVDFQNGKISRWREYIDTSSGQRDGG